MIDIYRLKISEKPINAIVKIMNLYEEAICIIPLATHVSLFPPHLKKRALPFKNGKLIKDTIKKHYIKQVVMYDALSYRKEELIHWCYYFGENNINVTMIEGVSG